MKKGKILFAVIVLLIGIVIGIAISLSTGAILSCKYHSTMLTSRHKTFGDIKIWAQKPLVAEDVDVPSGFYQEAHKLLWMTKNDVPFLMISQNEAAKTTGLYLLKNKDEPILCLEPLGPPGRWGRAKYSGGNGTGKPVGDVFVDIDFDGHFDFKLVFDSDGKRISRSMFVDGSWQKVDRCSIKNMKVAIGEKIYIFDPNSGWRKE